MALVTSVLPFVVMAPVLIHGAVAAFSPSASKTGDAAGASGSPDAAGATPDQVDGAERPADSIDNMEEDLRAIKVWLDSALADFANTGRTRQEVSSRASITKHLQELRELRRRLADIDVSVDAALKKRRNDAEANRSALEIAARALETRVGQKGASETPGDRSDQTSQPSRPGQPSGDMAGLDRQLREVENWVSRAGTNPDPGAVAKYMKQLGDINRKLTAARQTVAPADRAALDARVKKQGDLWRKVRSFRSRR